MDDKRVRFDAEILPHLDAAYRFARWLSRSPVDVDDIVQDSILRAFRGFHALRDGDAKAWLLTIVRNCHATAMLQQKRRAYVPLPEEHDLLDGHAMVAATPDPESESIDRDHARSLARLLSMLADGHREVLVLRELEDMSYKQIAAVLDLPVGTVMSRLARARSDLRKQWLEQLAGETRGMR